MYNLINKYIYICIMLDNHKFLLDGVFVQKYLLFILFHRLEMATNRLPSVNQSEFWSVDVEIQIPIILICTLITTSPEWRLKLHEEARNILLLSAEVRCFLWITKAEAHPLCLPSLALHRPRWSSPLSSARPPWAPFGTEQNSQNADSQMDSQMDSQRQCQAAWSSLRCHKWLAPQVDHSASATVGGNDRHSWAKLLSWIPSMWCTRSRPTKPGIDWSITNPSALL